MKQILIVLAGIVLLAVSGGIGYALGTENGLTQAQNIRTEFFQQRTGVASQQGQPTQPGQGGTQPGAFGSRSGIAGTVKSVDGNTIQLTGQDGSAIIVKVDDKTTIQKSTPATLADIRASTRITVTGDSSSGTMTARTIQIAADRQ